MARIQLCTATRVMLNRLCTWNAKTRAIPSLHHDNIQAKVPGLCPALALGNATSLYCRTVMVNENIPCTLDRLITLTITEKLKSKIGQLIHVY